MTQRNTRLSAKAVEELRLRRLDYGLTESLNERSRRRKRSVRWQLRTKLASGLKLARSYCAMLLTAAARLVENETRECSSSTTVTARRSTPRSRSSSLTDRAGAPRPSAPSLGNVVSFAPTATRAIQRLSSGIMQIHLSDENLPISAESMASAEVLEGILEKISGQKYDDISLTEFLQASFILLYSGNVMEIQQKFMYGGNIYRIETAVRGVTPPYDYFDPMYQEQ